jgi:hypothetical protein
MQFNYSHEGKNISKDPQYQKAYGQELPRLTASQNSTYLQFIDTIQYLWNRDHPEIQFRPFADNHTYNPDKGYVIYSLVDREPTQNNAKARYQEMVQHPDDPDKKLVIYSWAFMNSVKFTAVHQDPRIAEEIIEAFEDFMIATIPIHLEIGVQSSMYGRRASDEHKSRYGDDLAARSLIWMIIIQKIITTDLDKLKEILIEVQHLRVDTPYEQATPDHNKVKVALLDNHATPST